MRLREGGVSATPRPVEGSHGERAERLAIACGGLSLVVLSIVVPYRTYVDGYLNHVSGAWAALADDVAHGVLYRPLLSELGYGGTRNFPLHIVLHGLLTALGLSLRAAGHLISLGSGVLLVTAAATALRRLGATPKFAWAAGVLVLASRTAVMGMAGVRGDLLPVALGVMGIALVPRSTRDPWLPSAAFLALSLLAKPTLAWAPAGAVLALVIARRLKQATVLAASVGALAGAGLLLANVASKGQMLASFRACASGGGFSLEILRGALGYLRPGDALWILGGAALTLERGRRGLEHPVGMAGLVCLPMTLFVLSSRGTHVNHLVDASAIGGLAIAAATWEASGRALQRIVFVVTACLGLLETVALDGMLLRHGELDETVAALPRGSAPLLSEQPWVPLLAGERAFSVDAYGLLQVRRVLPPVNEDLTRRLDACRFRAVVLLGRAESSERWYDTVHFGSGFREHLLAHYALSRIVGGHAIYLPHCATPAPSGGSIAGETILEREQRPSALRAFVRSLRGN